MLGFRPSSCFEKLYNRVTLLQRGNKIIIYIKEQFIKIFLQRFLKDIELPIIFTIEDLGQNCPKIARLQLKFDDDVVLSIKI